MTRSRRRRAVDERPARCGPQANPRGTGTVSHAADSMMPGLSPGHGHAPPERCLLDQYVFTQMLLVSGDSLPPVQAELHYRLCDPFAVQLRMLLAGFDAVSWTLSRELLIAGISRPSGRGDIRICPGGDGVLIELRSAPHPPAVLLADRSDIEYFLRRSLSVVPIGSEVERYDIDAGLLRLRNRKGPTRGT